MDFDGLSLWAKLRVMTEKTIEIIAPEGYEVDKERSSFEKIVFRALPDKLPKTWEEIKEVKGWWVEDGHEIVHEDGIDTWTPLAVFPTKEEAEASIALAQLCQLRDRYNGQIGCRGCGYMLSLGETWDNSNVIRFKTKELRNEFAKNFADLIEKAKPLLG